jgi:Fe-S oxidoreductase
MKLLPDDFETQLIKCSECGFCRPACPTLAVKMTESWGARGRNMIIKAVIDGRLKVDEEVLKRLYSCALCKACEVVCPSKVKVVDIMEIVRSKLTELELAPLKEHKEMIDTMFTTGNIFGESLEFEKTIISSPVETLLFPGCMAVVKNPEIKDACIKLLEKAGINFTVFEDKNLCCSGYAKMLGVEKKFEEYVAKQAEKIFSLGIKQIVTPCPLCYTTLKEDYPFDGKIKVIHLSELLSDLLKSAKINFTRKVDSVVVFKDPCHLGRWEQIYDPPRYVLSQIPGIKIIEFTKNRENAQCCGGTIRIPFMDMRTEMSNKLIEDAENLGADLIVTSCPSCFFNISSSAYFSDVKVVDLSILAAYAAELIDELIIGGE